MATRENRNDLLAAYADGELDEAETREVDAWLADHPEGRDILAMHRDTTALLRAAFPESAHAAGAERLLSGARLRPRPTSPPPSRPGTGAARHGWALAASILVGLLGYGAGAIWPGLLVSERSQMLSEIAEYHAVYSRETVHLVEVPASQADHLKTWLGKRVNRPLVIPDLTEAGLTFAGGRMVVLDGAPVAELMYTRAKGLPIAFCVINSHGGAEPVRVDQRGAINLASWRDASHLYVVVGEADPDTIRGLASRAQPQL